MLVARGLIEEQKQEIDSKPRAVAVKVDTREQARQRAERSRRERELARMKADSMQSDSLVADSEIVAR